MEVLDAFLSFRGEDVRKNFVDHLYFALDQKGIFTFKDDERLDKGKSIAPDLLKSIEESRFAIIVFSKTYASSSWCLDELAKIMEWSKTMGQTVMPVFYDVYPSDVRKQTGDFGKAFAKHEESEKVGVWKKALEEAANISGWDVHKTDDGHESKCIQRIVLELLCKLGGTFASDVENLVGIEFGMEKVNSLLGTGSDDVRFVGIWGLSGIGKTTIARAVFDRISNQFEGCCFLHEVRDAAKKHNLEYLQNKLLSEILLVKNFNTNNVFDGVSMIKERLCSRRVLVVLDDVDKLDQLEALAGTRDWFGSGSRIIITTKNKQLLVGHEDCRIHEMSVLNDDEALQLFSWKAFKKIRPTKGYEALSLLFVHYAGGLPLVLRVLGSALHGSDITIWRSALDRLTKRGPDRKILEAINIGFDGLEDTEKEIFLDIACFFNGYQKEYVTRILDSFDLHPHVGLSALIQKSLISVSHNMLLMHQLVQEMGWHIVRQSSPDEPGKRSRLWFADDIKHVLKRGTGTGEVKGMLLDLLKPQEINACIEGINVRTEDFIKMNRLRLLIIHYECIPRHLEYLPDELRWLNWHRYPYKFLPSSFQGEKLVGIEMSYSRTVEVCKRKKVLNKLKYIDLSHSQKLIRTPDFTEAPNIEELVLEGCTGLQEVHESVGLLKRISLINLKGCENLRRLPNSVHSKSLKIFILSGCLKLEKFPDILVNMEHLLEVNLEGTSIKELPPSIKNLTSLVRINLSNCKNLRSLPNTIYMLKRQKALLLSGCSKFDKLSEDLAYLECLVEIHVDGTAIRELPSSIGLLTSLVLINLKNCENLTGLPSTICHLKSLKELILSGCSKLEKLPEDLGCLEYLEELRFDGTAIKELPSSVEHLTSLVRINLSNCKNLMSLPSTLCMLRRLKALVLSGCSKLDKLPGEIGNLECLEELVADGTAITQSPSSIVCLKNLMILSLSGCKRTTSKSGTSLSLFLLFPRKQQGSVSLVLPSLSGLCLLGELDISHCNMIKLPNDLGCLPSLTELHLEGNKFVTIPATGINQLTRLCYLSLVGCKRLEELPELPSSVRLLNVDDCTSLRSFPDLLFTKGVCLENVSFVNCLKLLEDQQGKYKSSILLQHLLQRLSDLPYNFKIYFPGRDIPGWFSNQNDGDSISVRIPTHCYNNNKVVGFALCIIFASIAALPQSVVKVVPRQSLEAFAVRITVNGRPRGTSYWHIGTDEIIDSEHVCLAYQRWCFWKLGDEIEVFVYGCDEDTVVRKLGIRIEYSDGNTLPGNPELFNHPGRQGCFIFQKQSNECSLYYLFHLLIAKTKTKSLILGR